MPTEIAGRDTPRQVKRLLLEYGGKTPTGLPMWRLVRAGDCTIVCQGRVHHFPRGVEIDINVRPTRISGGRAVMPRYRDIPRDHWILQKWFPPAIWGSCYEWRAHRGEEIDTPILVEEFPAQGDYFMLAGPWRDWREAGDLAAAIRLYLLRERSRTRDAEAFIRMRMADEAHERARNLEHLEREIARADAQVTEMARTVSADAQRMREQMAAAAGLDGHLGASEAWG